MGVAVITKYQNVSSNGGNSIMCLPVQVSWLCDGGRTYPFTFDNDITQFVFLSLFCKTNNSYLPSDTQINTGFSIAKYTSTKLAVDDTDVNGPIHVIGTLSKGSTNNVVNIYMYHKGNSNTSATFVGFLLAM